MPRNHMAGQLGTRREAFLDSMDDNDRSPTFFVLGAAKCGTTSLCAALTRHPDVFFSDPKEPVFFEREYERGLAYYWNQYFEGWSGEPAVGEGRVFHLYLPFVPPRIRESVPDARLIALLRDPVDRAHSHWWHRVTRGYERRSFEEAVTDELRELQEGRPFDAAQDPASWDRNFFPGTRGSHADVRELRYLEMGHYAEQLRRYFDLFPEKRLRIVFFEDLVRDAPGLLAELFEFLEVDPDRGQTELPRRNVGLVERKGRLGFLLERLAWTFRVHSLAPKRLRTAVRRALSRQAERPAMDDHVRRRLRGHFAPLNHELESLVGRELDAWSARSA